VETDRTAPEPTTDRWSALGAVLLSALYLWIVLWLGLTVLVPAATLRWTPLAVTSGSMEPAIRVGDVVLTSPPEHPMEPGHVITFDDPARPGTLVTHRIVSVDADGRYRTQGDANPTPDSTLVTPDLVEGRGRILVPMAGLPLLWATGNPLLLIVFVAVTVAAAVVVAGPRRRDLAEQPAPVVA
jgi:signal peptidase I